LTPPYAVISLAISVPVSSIVNLNFLVDPAVDEDKMISLSEILSSTYFFVAIYMSEVGASDISN
jgi:hypothetical protein